MAAETAALSELRESILIDGRPDEIYEYFTDSAKMIEWMGQSADLDPRPGGELAISINGAAVRGHYQLLEPPHRLVFSWGFAHSAELPPDASTVEIQLTKEGDGTRVELIHTGLPEPERSRHAPGWRHFLARLAALHA